MRKWSGYTPRQAHSASTATSAVTPAQIIPQLIFSGVTERFPRLKCVFAEAGIGGLNYVLAACDHEWECRHLWTEGIATRPSETVRRQMYVNFWFEAEGIKLRHDIGIDNIMWESDFPHVASFYPRSWESIERVVNGVPAEDRRKLLYENAIRVYGIRRGVARQNHLEGGASMQLKYGFISVDDHIQEPPDLWTHRLSKKPLGRPHSASGARDGRVERWVVDGTVAPRWRRRPEPAR